MRRIAGDVQYMTLEIRPNSDLAWTPSQAYRERSRLLALMTQNGIDSVDAWRAWAAEDIGRYWGTMVEDLGLDFTTPYSAVVDLSKGAPWAEWFVDGGFNYVANALDRHAAGPKRDRAALIWEGDDGTQRTVSFGDLLAETNRLANVLGDLGIERGDVVGIFMPMAPETVSAVLACGKIGAIYTPLFSGFGAEAVASRLRDCDAKLLITADGFFRRGNVVPMKPVADEAVAASPTVKHVLVLRRASNEVGMAVDRDIWWHDVVPGASPVCETVETRANEPYMVIYTSGTTGRPKGAVHVHAGFPIKAAHDLAYCFDLHDDDVLFWYTDLGWMMGPWAIGGGLMLGATLMLFEGTPDYPNPDRIWEIVERHRVTILGIAPTAIRALIPKGDEWPARHDLSSLRVLGSTGETWNPEPWRWYFERIGGGELPIVNYSGGTETGGGIVGCDTISPITPCCFTGPVVGMDADVVDDDGNPVRGAVGELVIRQPWVGMTRGFWRDPDRYIDTYWSRMPGLWVHGDWAEVDEDGFWFIRGRSDDTLKVAGKRVGPAEVESAAVAHDNVQEAAAIGIPHAVKGETVVVLCVLKGNRDASGELAEEIRRSVGHQLGSALRPECVHFVRELPRTRNAKIMRRVIRAAYLGLPPGDITALENPAAVDQVAAIGRSVRG
ncbi:MAG TPA: AMP-binding protein, partial [Thermomicrobiales bacterium]|nr:AMP-binding protein [Thermomicrobiales bacterium]